MNQYTASQLDPHVSAGKKSILFIRHVYLYNIAQYFPAIKWAPGPWVEPGG